MLVDAADVILFALHFPCGILLSRDLSQSHVNMAATVCNEDFTNLQLLLKVCQTLTFCKTVSFQKVC